MKKKIKFSELEIAKLKHDFDYLNDRQAKGLPDSPRTNAGNNYEIMCCLYPSAFDPYIYAVYFHLLKWASGDPLIIHTCHDAIERKTRCGRRKINRAITVLILFGLIKRLKKGTSTNGLSTYSISSTKEVLEINGQNAKEILTKYGKPVF